MSALDGVLAPQGALTIATVGSVFDEGRRRLAVGDLLVDFGQVSSVDSAALALILGWLRSAAAAGTRLAVRNLPASLHSLAAVYDIESLLPAESHA